jgi:hypothetical protein
MQSLWCVYVSDKPHSRVNFPIGMQSKVWGVHDSKRESIENIVEGDLVAFVYGITWNPREGIAPKGFSRVSDVESFKGDVKKIVIGTVVHGYFESDEEIWPDDDYPHRFKFDVLTEMDNEFFSVDYFNRDFVNAIRRSACTQGSVVKVDSIINIDDIIVKKRIFSDEPEVFHSWSVENNVAIKTVDKTLIKEFTTGIPRDMIGYFIDAPLKLGESKKINVVISGLIIKTEIIRKKDGRYIFPMQNISRRLRLNKLSKDVDTVWFDKIHNDTFCIATKSQSPNISIIPRPPKKPGKSKGTRNSIINVRPGQPYYKTEVARICNHRCFVTGVKDLQTPLPSILNASHAKAWVDCDDEEAVDGSNGLLLAPHIDKLFDRHLITFTVDSKILISKVLDLNILKLWNIDINAIYLLNKEQQYYMQLHRNTFDEKESGRVMTE